MKHFLLLFFILFIFKTKAQENTAFKEEIFTIVEEMPIYAGCNKSSQQLNNKCTIKGIINFLLDSVLPLASEKIVNDLGKIYLSFIVDVDGSARSFSFLNSDSTLNEKIINKLMEMPKFTPGKQRGIPVKVKYRIPFYVRIE